jgi:alcohol dehydrogenase YqhD (iron-dependent ADH family)
MMSHVFERYFTITTHTDLTDGLCETVARTIMKNAPAVLADPKNYDAWCEVCFGGTVATTALWAWAGAGLGLPRHGA